MGQYYKPTILGNRCGVEGYFIPRDYNDGSKLMEHSYMGGDVVTAVLRKICHQPKRVAWIGDYSEEPYDGTEPYQKLPCEKFRNVYKRVWGGQSVAPSAVCISSAHRTDPLEGFSTPDRFLGWYLINHSAREYVDLGKFQQNNGWVESWTTPDGDKVSMWYAVDPLPLLTACGNDRGGGDYHDMFPDFDKVGAWAFDLIEFANYKPVGFTELDVHFTEQHTVR